jgi:serine/threonine protein kinase
MTQGKRDFDELLKKLASPASQPGNVLPILPTGSLVAERFRVARLIARGGMGEVYEVQDLRSGQHVALKCLLPHLMSSKAFARFELEAQTLARVGHPAIVRVFETGKLSDSRPFFCMELLRGQSLEAELEHSGVLPVSCLLTLAQRLCDGLDAAHQQRVIHRDVKPENVFLVSDAPEPASSPHALARAWTSVKLMDFGIAKELHQGALGLTSDGITLGTPAFMAPEQIRGDQDLDQRVDVYGLGALLYRAATGRPAFEGRSFADIAIQVCERVPVAARELRPELSVELSALISIAMAKEPSQRFQSSRAMARALSSIELH